MCIQSKLHATEAFAGRLGAVLCFACRGHSCRPLIHCHRHLVPRRCDDTGQLGLENLLGRLLDLLQRGEICLEDKVDRRKLVAGLSGVYNAGLSGVVNGAK